MFWVAAFLVVGGVYTFVNSDLFMLMLFAVVPAILLGFILMGAMWVNDRTGVSSMMVGSWQYLSGVDTPGEIVAECPEDSNANFFLGMAIILIMLVVAIANVVIGATAIIGIPLGVLMTIVGGLHALATQSSDMIARGLGVLTVGLGAVVASGLVMRLINVVTTYNC